MNLINKHKALVMGVGIIVLTNTIALGGVAFNRNGAVDSNLQLSERELGFNNYDYDDNSGIAVDLKWHVLSLYDKNGMGFDGTSYGWTNYSRDAYWLTNAKLQELGFDTSVPDFRDTETYRYKEFKDREVYLVLEFNGPTYQRYLDQVKAISKERKDKMLGLEEIKLAENAASRLFAIDAGTHAEVLRKRYPDRNMYVVARGVVGANWQSTDAKPVLNAYIRSLSVSRLHVPKPHDAVFSGYIIDNARTARYQVDVAYGQRHEPWIMVAKRTQ